MADGSSVLPDLFIHFPSRYICSLGGQRSPRQSGVQPVAPRAHLHMNAAAEGRLSDSLIKQCEQSKPLCCSAVNRIRETLVLLPPRLIPFLYCN